MKGKKVSICRSLKFMFEIAWQNVKSVIGIGIVFAIVNVIYSLVQLFIAPVILEKVEKAVPLGELIGCILLFTLSMILLQALLGYLETNMIFGRIEVRTMVIRKINHKTYNTSYPNTKDERVLKQKEEAMRQCQSNSSAAENIWNTVFGLLTNIMGFVIYLFLLSNLNLILLVVVVLTTVIGFFVNRYINGWEYRHKDERAEYDKELHYLVRKTESIQLAKDIRIFGLDKWLNDTYSSTRRMAEAFARKRESIYFLTCVVDVILQVARNGIAFFYLVYLVIENEMPASEFLLYFTAFTGFSNWVTGILSEFVTLHKEALGIKAILDYIDLQEPFRFGEGEPIPPYESYELTLEHVSFKYPGTHEDCIRDMNLTIHAGENLAIVGLNGAGKTTLIKLLCGFYDPDEGRVLLNGKDIRDFNRQEYYDLFSAVFQDMSVLDVTIEEEVAQKVEGIDRKRVEECIEKAGLTDKIQSLPKGIETHIGKVAFMDGVELSGGQMQRLMLARALYKNGPILVLDEPTAALDPIAESDIYQKYHSMTMGKTSIFISHRLASTRFCDRILFIKDGIIAEEGTHESLMRKGEDYAKLFHVQARYYVQGGDFHETIE